MLGGTFEAGALANGGFRTAAWLPTHGNGPLEFAALEGAFTETSQEGARAPLSDEILTWPRVLGSGCVALLVILPTAGFLVVLLTTAALR
ncbi:hypothetical protein [Streptomyces canus]|uniref:hypothetical protein n=1 Tax=Streptomyces canus TaxID=58343 RepID=UPI00380FC3DC